MVIAQAAMLDTSYQVKPAWLKSQLILIAQLGLELPALGATTDITLDLVYACLQTFTARLIIC
jgi:hypothetical protein